MREALREFDEDYIAFICKECSLTYDELMDMNDDELYYKVYETMCNIEIEEVCNDDGEETERCELASDIVTALGNTLD